MKVREQNGKTERRGKGNLGERDYQTLLAIYKLTRELN